MKEPLTIAFIGGGNMARSLIGGLIDAGSAAGDITVADPLPATGESLQTQFNINTTTDNKTALGNASIVVLAVKPQLMKTVVTDLTGLWNGKLLISVAAGITTSSIIGWSGDKNTAVVRCMPNTPALLGCGATGLFATTGVSVEQRQQAESILAAVGTARWVDTEQQLDAVTALSGSGPAYFFLLLESMIDAAQTQGLPPELASEFAIETALGAARMAKESNTQPAQLRRNVTSRAGTTEAALNSFEADDFQQIVANAMMAANNRAAELGKELGDKK